MNQLDLIRKFQSKLPAVREWIDSLLERHKEQAVPVIKLGYVRLHQIFPKDLLERSQLVVVTTKLPFPPVRSMGLPEFGEMENMSREGITYKNTFFINRSHQTESLCFHELVHVIQWERLGVDNFLLAYGVGLRQSGYLDYLNSPLEDMAYSLQADFDRRSLPTDVVGLVQQGTDAIWHGVASLLFKAREQ
ncbi:MAG: hypothetical protein MUP30_00510 [Deltaproteobacteria bacterium]|nr:hypothetical protein [Deltaproteobacteria bacterium]